MFSVNRGHRDPFASLILSIGSEQDFAKQCKASSRNQFFSPKGPIGVESPVVVHIHAYYPELLPELLTPIAQHWPGPSPSLFITVPSDGCGDRLEACRNHLRSVYGTNPPPCEWLEVENRGRNLLPLLQVVRQLISLDRPPCSLLHLHTKLTLDPDGIGHAWRRDLLEKLLGDREQIATALRLLADPAVGLVAPCRYRGIEQHYNWGGNFALAKTLVPQCFPGRTLHADQLLQFPAGLMFWCRPQALRPLLALPLDQTHFPPEPLGTNGSVPHALERLICHCVEAAGLEWRLINNEAEATNLSGDHASEGARQPSVWQRQSTIYEELLNEQLRDQRDQLHTEQERSQALGLRLHRAQRQLRRPWRPGAGLPLNIALVLQRAGRGYISSAHLRLLEPLTLLEQQGRCHVQIVDNPQADQLWGTELVIAQRGALADPAASDRLHRVCEELGLPLIADIDDALCSLTGNHAERQRYENLAAATDRLLAHCDHAIFSTAVLASTYRSHLAASGVQLGRFSIVANGLSPRLWRTENQGLPPRRPLRARLPLHILYMGSRTHDEDFSLLLPQLDALEAEQPGRFQLHVIGALNDPPERPWLQLRLVPLRVRRYPDFVPWLLQRRPFHFGIAPLQANVFNAAKSDVKVLDYAALGLGSLCSIGPAYNDLIRGGLALGTANDQWQATLGRLLQDPRPVQRCGRRAERYLWRRRSCARVSRELWHVLHVPR